MRTLIANFKMNLTPSETKDYLMAFLSRFDGSKIDLTLCLPYTSLGIGALLCRDKNVTLAFNTTKLTKAKAFCVAYKQPLLIIF